MKYDGRDVLFNKYEMAGFGAVQIGIGAGLLAISSKQVKAGAWGKTTGNIVNAFGIGELVAGGVNLAHASVMAIEDKKNREAWERQYYNVYES